jgi:hypothetical protein
VGAACAAARSEGDASLKGRKACFFEKSSKKLLSLAPSRSVRAPMDKSLLVLFFRKELLSS